ncbi:NAD-dependent epimerase/dehydratase family protein [Actinomadura logoneensis]|uniref:NAD-dependent epimerase/dehydratase family protein n=1 Tax=Actinomadura logoneensis TaxID=2293572 RepID=A0A372JJG3_9ACTN|nr:NAD-dependent epimerase/dehydratase family protein [Actinomadura logoneensis]RFU40163.1 NAD-dependent epimerase/dehydratase family protein [Actinomadura logoneensis]
MRVLVLGAGGYVGSALTERLAAAGHEVVALARSGGKSVPGAAEVRVGDLADPASLTAAVTPDIDAVVHAATPSGDAGVDAAAVEALTAPLRGSGRAFVYTSGVWVLGATGDAAADEDAATRPIPIVGYRPEIERRVLDTAADGVRAAVVRPGIVHGRGSGIPAMLVRWAAEDGAPRLVGDPAVRWPMVHVDDLADLFLAVLTDAPAGTVWHGVSETAVPVRDLAVAAGRAAGVKGEPRVWTVEQAAGELGGPFAEALALDQSVSSRLTRDRLGWNPSRPGSVADLGEGSYA